MKKKDGTDTTTPSKGPKSLAGLAFTGIGMMLLQGAAAVKTVRARRASS